MPTEEDPLTVTTPEVDAATGWLSLELGLERILVLLNKSAPGEDALAVLAKDPSTLACGASPRVVGVITGMLGSNGGSERLTITGLREV